MKIFLLAVMMFSMVANTFASEIKKVISFGDAGMVLIESVDSSKMMPLDDFFTSGVLASVNGDMDIILSPHERIIFKGGKITDYFCVEELDHLCRAKLDGAQITGYFGGRADVKNQARIYFAKIHGLGENIRQLAPEAIRSIDGIGIKLSYKDDHFLASKKY